MYYQHKFQKFFLDVDMLILKVKWKAMDPERPILKFWKRKKSGPHITWKIYYKATVIRAMLYCEKFRYIDQ